jgi:tRNA A37 threonylcarbamoyladenosine modification protein TsaB
VITENIYPQAEDLVALIQHHYQQGHVVPAYQALPIYLRDDVV